MEARGIGLVNPMLLSPEPLHGVTVIVTGDGDGEEEQAADFTIFGCETQKKKIKKTLMKKSRSQTKIRNSEEEILKSEEEGS